MAEIYLHDLQIQSDEMEAARALKVRFEKELNTIVGKIWLIPSIDIHAATGTHDVDLLMIGYLNDFYINNICEYRNIQVKSFFSTIEIKSHSAKGILKEGTRLKVKYNDEVKDVTTQSEKQKNTVIQHLKRINSGSKNNIPFITNIIWLTGIDKNTLQELDLCNSNILASNSSFTEFSQAIGMQSQLRDNGYIDAFRSSEDSISKIAKIFYAKSQGADTMSLRKINLLLKDETDESRITNILSSNEKIIVLSGHAGTGKTIMLLHAALLMISKGYKCLFLTYNKALIADLKRTMSFFSYHQDNLDMNSMHSFLIGIMKKARIWTNNYDIQDFDDKIKEMNHKKSLKSLALSFYKYIFIDEAQDWKKDEAEIIKYYYKDSKIVIADGVDQFMRSTERVNWGSSPFPKLKKCMRQKANLTKFAKLFASKLGIYWDVEINEEIPGGKVIVCYRYEPELHSKLFENTVQDGCTAYDMMLLAPNSLVENSQFKLIDTYNRMGLHIYDGINPRNRESSYYGPENYKRKECRVYTYESCRGLEAWITVCLRFDELFEMPHPHDYSTIEYESARQYMLGLWSLMPLTRPIDTLVLCVSMGSKIDLILQEISKEVPDYVTYENYTHA